MEEKPLDTLLQDVNQNHLQKSAIYEKHFRNCQFSKKINVAWLLYIYYIR